MTATFLPCHISDASSGAGAIAGGLSDVRFGDVRFSDHEKLAGKGAKGEAQIEADHPFRFGPAGFHGKRRKARLAVDHPESRGAQQAVETFVRVDGFMRVVI